MVILCFNCLRNCYTVFHCGCTILHFHQQFVGVEITPHPFQHFFSNSQPNGISLWFQFANPLMISDVNHLFVYLLATCRSLKKCPFKFFVYFSVGLFCCCWVVEVLYVFWILTPDQIPACKYFLILRVAFRYVNGILWYTFFNFDEVQLIYFPFCCLCSDHTLLTTTLKHRAKVATC